MKAGCLRLGLLSLLLVVGIGLWAGLQYRQIKNDNAEARRVFNELCQPQKLYVSGTFPDWIELLDQIRSRSFEDEVHLRTWNKNADGETEWAIPQHDQILMTEFSVTFMDSDQMITLRDPVLIQKHFGIWILADGKTHTYCIRETEPELDRLLWS